MLNLRRYLSWLSVLLDKQRNNVGASPGLQLTTFQRRHNLVPSPDNLIALETPPPPKCLWLAPGFASEKSKNRIIQMVTNVRQQHKREVMRKSGFLDKSAGWDGKTPRVAEEEGAQVHDWSPVFPVGAFPGLLQGAFP